MLFCFNDLYLHLLFSKEERYFMTQNVWYNRHKKYINYQDDMIIIIYSEDLEIAYLYNMPYFKLLSLLFDLFLYDVSKLLKE